MSDDIKSNLQENLADFITAFDKPATTGNEEPTVETLQLLLKQSQKENALLYEELTQLKAWVKELMNHLSSSGT